MGNIKGRNKNAFLIQKYKNKNKTSSLFPTFEKALLKLMILGIIIISNASKYMKPIYSNESFITLEINKIGNMRIYGSVSYSNDAPKPFEIYINGINQSPKKSSYYLNQTENLIMLKWKDKIESTAYMFYACNNISKINFSNFDTSNVNDMRYMFYQCSGLYELDLSNFNTLNVTNMSYIFVDFQNYPK